LHKIGAFVVSVVGALGVKLPAILGHQGKADEVGVIGVERENGI
jgi:hypothetical protein